MNFKRTLFSLSLVAAALYVGGCDSDDDATDGADAGGATDTDGGGSTPGADGGSTDPTTGETSDCEVLHSCTGTNAEGDVISCAEFSGPLRGSKDNCEALSDGSLTYAYSESPCTREIQGFGCLARQDDGECEVTWVYGPGAQLSTAICANQGHQPVTR